MSRSKISSRIRNRGSRSRRESPYLTTYIEGICDLYPQERIPGVAMGEACGEGCEQDEQKLICLDDITAAGVPYCTHACEFRDDCPEGFLCVVGSSEDDKLCRRYPEGDAPGADLGDACSGEETGFACQIGLFCALDGDVRYCTGKCLDETSPLISTACPAEYCCQARRGGTYACLLAAEGEECEIGGFVEPEIRDDPDDLDDTEGGDGEAGADPGGDEAVEDDGSVDNSLCTTAPRPSDHAGLLRLFTRR